MNTYIPIDYSNGFRFLWIHFPFTIFRLLLMSKTPLKRTVCKTLFAARFTLSGRSWKSFFLDPLFSFPGVALLS